MSVSSSWWAAVATAAAVFAASTRALSADIPAEPEPLDAIIDQNFWYVSVHGGIKFREEWEHDWTSANLEFEAKRGWRVGGAAGYSLNSVFSLEGELSFMRQEADLDEAGLGAGNCCEDGSLSIITGIINLVAGVPIATWIRPYVGAGVGVAYVSFDDVDLDDSDVVFGAQGLAGVDFMLSDRFAVGGRYRLLHLDDVILESDGQGKHDLNADLMHSLEAVFTFGF